MQFEIDSKEVKDDLSFPENMPEGVKAALTQFMHILSETSSNSETRLKMNEVKATSKHQGINAKGEKVLYPLARTWPSKLKPGGTLLQEKQIAG